MNIIQKLATDIDEIIKAADKDNQNRTGKKLSRKKVDEMNQCLWAGACLGLVAVNDKENAEWVNRVVWIMGLRGYAETQHIVASIGKEIAS